MWIFFFDFRVRNFQSKALSEIELLTFTKSRLPQCFSKKLSYCSERKRTQISSLLLAERGAPLCTWLHPFSLCGTSLFSPESIQNHRCQMEYSWHYLNHVFFSNKAESFAQWFMYFVSFVKPMTSAESNWTISFFLIA